MNKLRALLVAAALLMAACGTATISGSQVKSISSSGTVRVDAGANAATDLSTNPTIRKVPGGPVPLQQSAAPATNGTQPSTAAHDRCSDGFPASTGAGTRNGAPGKRLPLPACAVQ